jgi:hypothetical protein
MLKSSDFGTDLQCKSCKQRFTLYKNYSHDHILTPASKNATFLVCHYVHPMPISVGSGCVDWLRWFSDGEFFNGITIKDAHLTLSGYAELHQPQTAQTAQIASAPAPIPQPAQVPAPRPMIGLSQQINTMNQVTNKYVGKKIDPVLMKELEDELLKYTEKMINKCECGSAKIGIKKGQIGHSSWCPWVK